MAFPISASATLSPVPSVISGSSCHRTKCFMRSPTCRRPLRPPPHLAVPARPQPRLDCRCNPILSSSSQRKIRSPCLRLLLKLKHPLPRRCSARPWLPLFKASNLPRLHLSSPFLPPLPLRHLCPPLALPHLRGDRRSLTFLLRPQLQRLCRPLAPLSLPTLQHRSPSLLPLPLLRLFQPSVPLRLQRLQRSSPFHLPLPLLRQSQPSVPLLLRRLRHSSPSLLQRRSQPSVPRSLPKRLHPLPLLLQPRLPDLHHHRPHRHSFLLHSSRLQLHPHRCNHSPERSNPSGLSSQPLAASLRPNRPHLSPGQPNLSIPSPRPPPAPWRPKHPQSQALAALNCSVRLPHRSSHSPLFRQHLRPNQPQACLPILPLHSRQHPRPNLPPACLPHRPRLPSSPRLPSLQPWKKFRPSPLLQLLHRSLPRVACSAPSL